MNNRNLINIRVNILKPIGRRIVILIRNIPYVELIETNEEQYFHRFLPPHRTCNLLVNLCRLETKKSICNNINNILETLKS